MKVCVHESEGEREKIVALLNLILANHFCVNVDRLNYGNWSLLHGATAESVTANSDFSTVQNLDPPAFHNLSTSHQSM